MVRFKNFLEYVVFFLYGYWLVRNNLKYVNDLERFRRNFNLIKRKKLINATVNKVIDNEINRRLRGKS